MDSGVLAETLAHLSWREALIAIIALLLVYVLVAFLRMRRFRRAKSAVDALEPLLAQAAVAAYAAEQEPALPVAEVAAPVEPGTSATRSKVRDFEWNEPPPEIPGQQMINALERNVYQLRGEVGELRAELLQVREEMRRELAKAQAAQNVSPLYSDAMQMAMKGHDATTVSERCGIARAEAELVVALVRNRADASWATIATSNRAGMEDGQ